ncbi:AAA domain-containing protein [Prevotella sp. tf2-5]|uniref:AAA domain-containing protein n=1 Tax=Prevotella sp. tf2-5 TaxID=1761889 RepID=UPI0008E9C785|nr:AAA domain-containing protein [Prevotella sp. tf2-5]SFO68376.1 DNA helicase, putative [Prevotella sp. tf2-5]
MSQQASPIQALQQQRLLLELEYQTEKETFRKQTEEMGVQRKVKRGDAWYPLKVDKSYYNSLNQLAVEVIRTSDQEIEHTFEFGKTVMFFSCEDNKIKYLPFTATVSYVDGDRMVCIIPNNGYLVTLQNTQNLGVQLSFDETSYRLMMEALDRAIKGKSRLGYLRDLFYTHQKAETFVFPPMHFPYLNQTQEDAVNMVLRAKDVAIVHGPPGTGKTTTLVEAIRETLMRESQVLVCAQSNMAVDWISEKLVDRGINVLRIGNPTRVNDKMLSFTYERRFEAHPDYPHLWAIRKAIRELRAHRKRGDEKFHQKLESLKGRATELEIRINNELFGEARVIACTLVGAANRLLDGQKYGTLFIDEAAQALEAACWIPIRRVSRVILAGDHCQLPPTVKSIAALKAGLDKTLMERIVEMKPEVVTLLKMQYRMNDDIMRFSSNYFYDGQVESAPNVKYRGILDLDVAMEWVNPSENSEYSEYSDKSFKETFIGESFGRINKDEAELTLNTLQQYFERISKQRLLDERIDVGIISPYRAQVQYLRRLLMKREFFKPFRRQISINTVDGFQGQERDIIVLSMVRSNDDGQIGFLRDLRRMNVAITRARMKVIILGDVATLTRHPFYRQLWQYIQSLSNA